MMWQVIKPHYWMLDRRIRGTNRIWIVLSITLLVLGSEWLYNHVLQDQLSHLCQVTPESVPLVYGQSVPPRVPRRQPLLCIIQSYEIAAG